MKKSLLLSLAAISFVTGYCSGQIRDAKREAAILSKLANYEDNVRKLETKLNISRAKTEAKRRGKSSHVAHVVASAYSPRKKETDGDPHINAHLKKPRPGTIAVSRDLFWNGWTFGKRVYIEGMGIYTISDLMHKRKRQQIDIFMGNTKDAYQFGRKRLRIALLK